MEAEEEVQCKQEPRVGTDCGSSRACVGSRGDHCGLCRLIYGPTPRGKNQDRESTVVHGAICVRNRTVWEAGTPTVTVIAPGAGVEEWGIQGQKWKK